MNKRSSQNEMGGKTPRTLADVSWPQTRVVLRVLVIFILVAITAWVIVKLTGVILLVVLSIFFAYLVSPVVDFLRRPITISGRQRAMPRVMAIAVAYLLIIGALVTGILLLVPRIGGQFPEFAEQARAYWRIIGVKTQTASDYLRLHRMPTPVLDAFNNVIAEIGHYGSAVLLPSMVVWLGYLPWLILIPILSFFLLKDAESFRRSALQMLPRGRWRWRGDEFFQDVSSTLAAYTRAQLTACFFIGLICTLGFTLLSLPSPLVLGLMAGIFEFVPLMGPLLIAIVAAIVAALHGGPFSAFLVLLFLGVLRIVQDYVVYPRLIGQGIHLHPLAVILAILAGHELGGVAGIFLALPVVAILTVSYKHWLEHRGSEGFADLIDPNAGADKTEMTLSSVEDFTLPIQETRTSHPTIDTTADDMARARPDLTTGELKIKHD
ncbi:MAG TPA: AI-2E family transporter [Pyrinomonadaceae bacterium]